MDDPSKFLLRLQDHVGQAQNSITRLSQRTETHLDRTDALARQCVTMVGRAETLFHTMRQRLPMMPDPSGPEHHPRQQNGLFLPLPSLRHTLIATALFLAGTACGWGLSVL